MTNPTQAEIQAKTPTSMSNPANAAPLVTAGTASGSQPSLRQDARRTGISEAEALAALGGERVLRLGTDHVALYEAMPLLGLVTVRTENHVACIEKTGRFEKMGHDNSVGLTLGTSIDLRIFYDEWAQAFAVREAGERSLPAGFYFFDAQGRAITSVMLTTASDHAAFDTLIARHTLPRQDTQADTDARPLATAGIEDEAVDTTAFRAAWDAMTDPHQFFGLLRRFGLSRIQAMRLARADQARRLQTDACGQLLQDVVNTALPIMVFIGNRGQIQIHTGPIHTVRHLDEWITAASPDLSLTLHGGLIDSVWAVRKPTSDGIVTSVELYDAAGENIAMLFGARKPGHAELAEWRATVARRSVYTPASAPSLTQGGLAS